MLTIREVLSDFRAYANSLDEVDVHSRASNGETPLHWMATLGDKAGIDLLLGSGAEINAKDELGNTALHAAIATRQAIAVKALIDAGADVRATNESGLSAADLAQADGFQPIMALFFRQW